MSCRYRPSFSCLTPVPGRPPAVPERVAGLRALTSQNLCTNGPRSPGMLATRYTLDRPACGRPIGLRPAAPECITSPEPGPGAPREHFGYRNLYAEGAWGG